MGAIGWVHCHGCCFSAVTHAFLVHCANKSLSELQAQYHSELMWPEAPPRCHHSDRKRCDGAWRQELKCRPYTWKGRGRTRCIISNSDSDILPAGPFPKPTGLKLGVSQKWLSWSKEKAWISSLSTLDASQFSYVKTHLQCFKDLYCFNIPVYLAQIEKANLITSKIFIYSIWRKQRSNETLNYQ